MQIFGEYIHSLPCTKGIKQSSLFINQEHNGLSDLFTDYFIQSNSKKCDIPEFTVSPITQSFHCDVIDTCILHLLHKSFTNNILTYGYQLAKNSDVVTKLFCHSSNTNVTLLKSNVWKLLHELIGTENFMNILLNHSVYLNTGYYFRQIIGNPINAPQVPPTWMNRKEHANVKARLTIDWNNVLYRNVKPHDHKILSSPDAVLLFKEIFPNKIVGGKLKGSKKVIMNNLRKCLKEFINNHYKVPFKYIGNKTCPKSSNDFYTSQKNVIRFLVISIRKTIPLNLLGSPNNFSVLYKAVSALVRKTLHTRLSMEELSRGLRINDVNWYKKSGSEDKTAHRLEIYQHQIQSNLLHQLFFWLLSVYVPKLVSMFFYVTELSGTINVVYIRHDVWKSMSRPFLKSYFKQYLLENKECQEHRSFSNSNFNHRNLRLIPKKSGSDFRVIAVPCKGINLQEVSDYNDYFKNAVKPTKIILERLRIRKSTKFAKAFSPVEIPMIISDYKRKLINKYGFVPNLHLLKFDIQSCYDSIPVDRVMKLIKREISSSKEFFLRSEDVLSLDSTRLKKRFFINGDSTKNKNDIVIDSVKSVVLSQLDILSVLEMELFKTSIVYRGKCYLRKDGLFQGTPLSSVLVDILYDNLLESYEEFKHADDNNALIIRLVDDFLVISPSKPYIDRINAIAQPGFKSFNAKVYPKKVLITSSELPGSESVPFCALQINLKTLEVWKDHSSYNVISGDFASTKQIFEKLLWIFEMRLSYNMLDTNLNSLNIALLYIREVSLNLAESFISLFDKKKPTKTAFIQFMLNIFERIDLHLASNNITSAEKSSGLKRTAMSVFIQQLGLRRDKFKDILGTMDELNASII